jgi:hypothetical protein
MTDTEELVRRYLALWQEYLTALLAEPEAAMLLRAWIGLGSGRHERRSSAEHGADEAAGLSGSPAGAASATRPSGECDRLLGEFARRLARLEERMAAVEQDRRRAARARGRVRGARP